MKMHARSSNRPASPVSRPLPALCERRRPRRPYEVASGAGVHKAPAGTELELLAHIFMNSPGSYEHHGVKSEY